MAASLTTFETEEASDSTQETVLGGATSTHAPRLMAIVVLALVLLVVVGPNDFHRSRGFRLVSGSLRGRNCHIC